MASIQINALFLKKLLDAKHVYMCATLMQNRQSVQVLKKNEKASAAKHPSTAQFGD